MNKIQFWRQSLLHLIPSEKVPFVLHHFMLQLIKICKITCWPTLNCYSLVRKETKPSTGRLLWVQPVSRDGTAVTGALAELMPPRSRVFSESIGGSSGSAN